MRTNRRRSRLRLARTARLSLPLSAILVCSILTVPAAGSGFEAAGPVPASSFLRPEELAGGEWKVAPQALNDGVFNTYTIESRFGALEARGRSQLGFRVKEVEALAELETVSKSKVFVDALAASALAPVRVVASFAEQPKETVKGIGSGVKRLWGKTKFQAQELSHDAKEVVDKDEDGAKGEESEASKTDKAKAATSAYAKKYLGLTRAERNWYAKLGVDPYTDNEALKKGVKEVSRVEAAAKFGIRFAGIPSIPGAREIGKVMDLVWKTDPWELRKLNREVLLAAGVSVDTARQFEDNSALSPTIQTALIQSLQALDGVGGRIHIIERAIGAETTADGRLLAAATALLVRSHRDDSPLAEILAGSRLPAARTKDGRIVAVAAVDKVYWTEEVAEAATAFTGIYAGEKAASRELKLVGQASPRFVEGMDALGWKVADRWQIAAAEDSQPAPKTP